MEARCKEMTNVLWDDALADLQIAKAAEIVREVVGEQFDGDHIRTEPVKDALVARFKCGMAARAHFEAIR